MGGPTRISAWHSRCMPQAENGSLEGIFSGSLGQTRVRESAFRSFGRMPDSNRASAGPRHLIWSIREKKTHKMYICGTSPNHAAISPAKGGSRALHVRPETRSELAAVGNSSLSRRMPPETHLHADPWRGRQARQPNSPPDARRGKNGVHGKWAVAQTYPCLSRKYTCHSYHPPSPAYTRGMEGGGSNLTVSCHGCHLAGSRIAQILASRKFHCPTSAHL